MAHRKGVDTDTASTAFVQEICTLYGDCYDDRLEDSRPPAAGRKNGSTDIRLAGEDWEPGTLAAHKSLSAFQKELAEKYDVFLSTSKIRKILISGGCWTTERSREVQSRYDELCREHQNLRPDQVAREISKELGISVAAVSMNLPYINGVNKLENPSKNAVRCARYRKRKKEK